MTLDGWCDYIIIVQAYFKYIIRIQGGSGVVFCDWAPLPSPLPCENLEFFLNLCLVLKQYITLEQYSTSLLFLLLSFIYYFRKYNGKHRNCLYTCGRPNQKTMLLWEKVSIWPNLVVFGKTTCLKCCGGGGGGGGGGEHQKCVPY